MTKTAILGWVTLVIGCAIWLYGYLAGAHPSVVDWHAKAPQWIADYLPNLESELGMLLCFVSLVPM
jgi:hypothetical protein